MSDDKRENLSALVDGELPSAKASRAIDSILGDPDMQAAWAHYHLVGDAMRDTLPVAGGEALAARVRTAIDAEPVDFSRRVRGGVSLRPLAGLALAATVAGVAILGVRALNQADVVSPARVAVTSPDRTVASTGAFPVARPPAGALLRAAAPEVSTARHLPAATPALTRLQWSDPRPGVEARLNAYLVNHNEYLGNGTRGLLPYARIVGYEPGQ